MPMPENLAARARKHGLRYVEADALCLKRRNSGRGFVYLKPDGRPIRSRKIIDRLNALAIPPAWAEVCIADDEKAHIQAIGRDSEGRLQYRYHDDWTSVRDKVKAERLLRFGAALPAIRMRLEKDLQRRRADRRYAAAVASRMIDRALLRSGHYTATMDDGGRGVTTLLKSDVQLNGTKVELNFTGKGGKQIRKSIHDRLLPPRLRKLKRIGTKRLFAFRDEKGRPCYLSARDLNAYLREAARAPVTAKDFRTFAASAQALAALCEAARPETETARKSLVVSVIKQASRRLANTPAVTRSSYVHPLIIEAFGAGTLDPSILGGTLRNGLDKAETALMRFLEDTVGIPGGTRPAGKNGSVLVERAGVGSSQEERQRWRKTRSRLSGRSSEAAMSA
jgi:DNA topoisomerase-1